MSKPAVEKVQLWLVRKTGTALECLLLLTQPRGELGSFWQPVTGKLDAGESAELGALREAHEETGLAVDEASLRQVGEPFQYRSRWGGEARETPWVARVQGTGEAVRLDPDEHQAYAWVALDQARDRLTFESYLRILDRVAKAVD